MSTQKYVEAVILSANTPTKEGRGWLPNPKRTDEFVKWMNSQKVGAAALQELATVSCNAFERHKRHDLTKAFPNNHFPNNQIGNAIDTVGKVKVLDHRNIRIKTDARPRGLNMIEGLLDFGNDAQAIMIAFHLISGVRQIDRISREECLTEILRRADKYRNKGIPVIPLGDTNSGIWAEKTLKAEGFKIGIRGGVDLIAVSDDIKTSNGRVHEDGKGVWTDHPLVTCTAQIPVSEHPRTRLP